MELHRSRMQSTTVSSQSSSDSDRTSRSRSPSSVPSSVCPVVDRTPGLTESRGLFSSIAPVAMTLSPFEPHRRAESTSDGDLMTFDDDDTRPRSTAHEVHEVDWPTILQPSRFDTLFAEVEDRMHTLFQRYAKLKERRAARKITTERSVHEHAENNLIELEVEIDGKMVGPSVPSLCRTSPMLMDEPCDCGGSDSTRTSITTSSYSRFPEPRIELFATEYLEKENRESLRYQNSSGDKPDACSDREKKERLQKKVENLREIFEQALRQGRNRDAESLATYHQSCNPVDPQPHRSSDRSGDRELETVDADESRAANLPAKSGASSERGESSDGTLPSHISTSCSSSRTSGYACSSAGSDGNGAEEISSSASAHSGSPAEPDALPRISHSTVGLKERPTHEITCHWEDGLRIPVGCGLGEAKDEQADHLQYHDPPASLQNAFRCHKQIFLERSRERQEQILRNREMRRVTEEQLRGATEGCSVKSEPVLPQRTAARPKEFPKRREKPDLCKPLWDRPNVISLKTAKEETERRLRQFQPPNKPVGDLKEEIRCRRRRLVAYSRLVRHRNHHLYGERRCRCHCAVLAK